MSTDAAPRRISPGAVRMRRLRQRRHQGIQVVALELYREDVEQLAVRSPPSVTRNTDLAARS
jgi:hypothetical protein